MFKLKRHIVCFFVFLFLFTPSFVSLISEQHLSLRRVKPGSTNPTHRLSEEEARAIIVENMLIIKDNLTQFKEAFLRAVEIYEEGGLSALEQEGFPLIEEAAAPVREAVYTIRNLPRYIGFADERSQTLIEGFLSDLAQEFGADKIIIDFGGALLILLMLLVYLRKSMIFMLKTWERYQII